MQTELAEIKRCVRVPFKDRAAGLLRSLFGRAEKTGGESVDWDEVLKRLATVKEMLSEAVAFTMPNFFAMGYYLTFAQQPLPGI